MLMEVKNQFKVTFLAIKYGIMREMLNKSTFIINIIFMIINNATFLIQWLVLYSLKNDIGGYTFKQVLLLWGIAASTFGFSHFFFKKVYSLSDTITNGKLDAYLVQPKNVLISAITSDVDPSAVGDMIYGILMLSASGFSLGKFILFIIFTICGGLVITSIAIILASLSFWIHKADLIADTGNSIMTNFATYPDGIFDGIAKFLLFVVFPIGITTYIPVWVISNFSILWTLVVLGATIVLVLLAFFIFYKGLKKYSSSNLMMAKI